jgi:hypothetical protein
VTTVALTAFLVVHGLLHLAIWLPHPEPDPAKPAPFDPDHSSVLALARVRESTGRRLATALASATAGAYVVAGLLLAVGSDAVVPAAVLAAVLGLALKALYFHPWLSLGVLLDLGVLSAALVEWPVSLV